MVELPPTPPASTPATRRAMQANRRSNTQPELAVRKLLHQAGLRYRVDLPIVAAGVRVRPDVALTRAKIAVFVDGCFWHGCPEHFRLPSSNVEYWRAKMARNRARDRRDTRALEDAGWLVVRAWAHEPPAEVAERVEALAADRR